MVGKYVDRTGEKYITNEGYTVEIIEYFNAHNCTIQFEDKNTIKNLAFYQIRTGQIKNIFHKSVFGKGFRGKGSYKIGGKKYSTWIQLLRRCYDEKYQEKQPTYKDVVVCEEWHNFQNFAKWFEENYIEGFHLDKDILFKGNKIYSPETCAFVPQEINSLFTNRGNYRGIFPIGVLKRGEKFRSCVSSIGQLGTFDTPEEAFQAYKTAKERHIKEVAEKWKDKITEQTYQALINYKVEIDD